MELKKKHVLVTGGGKRLGRALCERFLQEGAILTSTYNTSKEAAEDLVKYAESIGKSVHIVQAGLGAVSQIQGAVDSAIKAQGPVDILINSASTFFPTSSLTCSEKDWADLLDTNLKGQFFFAQACAKAMAGRQGLIINFGDVNGEHPLRNFTPYTVSKAGVLMLTKNLALEWAPKIRVNSISPGPVLVPETFTEEQKVRAAEKTLFKRLGTAQDIVEGVLFLIRNDYVTGFNLVVDGGNSLA